MKKFTFLSVFLFAFTVLLISCSKTGPTGPQGATGPAGPTGPQGPGGSQGPAGTANVIYSAWFSPGPWSDTTLPLGGTVSHYIKAAPGITQQIIDNGLVLSYTQNGGANYQLPWDFVNPFSVNQTLQLGLASVSGEIIYFIANVTTGSASSISYGNQLRYVIVPGGVAGQRIISGPALGHTVDELKAMSYQQIAKLFNIPDNGSNIVQ